MSPLGLLVLALCGNGGGSAPTFAKEIAPLVYARCAPCHHAGGAAPFSLVSYEEVHKRAKQIGLVTQSRYMPPWKPVLGTGEFLGDRSLSAEEIERITAWIAADAPLGDATSVPPPPVFPTGWQLGEPDVVLESEVFAVPAEGGDVWHTFVLPTRSAATEYVAALEFLPDGARSPHHFIAYVDTTGRWREFAEEDPDVIASRLEAQAMLSRDAIFSWLPGTMPRRFPSDLAHALPVGADVVLDTHFLTIGRPESVRMRIGLHLASQPPRAAPIALALGSRGLTIPPGATDYVVHDSWTLPADVDAHSVVSHAHYVCQSADFRAVLPDGRRIPLLVIDDWDFRWQDTYVFRDALHLPQGTRLEMVFRYDNSPANLQNPFDPPRRIFTGENAKDEMAIAWLHVTARDPADTELVQRGAIEHWRELAEDAHWLARIWDTVVLGSDVDADGSLDPEEEGTASRFVNGLLVERPKLILKVFDDDQDGTLDASEEEEVQRIIRLWNGAPND
jgi:hypothetical protein